MEQAGDAGEVGDSGKRVTWADFIHDAAVECIRHGLTLADFWALTPADYGWMREAWELAALDDDYRAAQAAWLNARANDRRKSGNGTVLVHTDFNEFFPYEKKLSELRKRQDIRAGRREPGEEKLRKLSKFLAKQQAGEVATNA